MQQPEIKNCNRKILIGQGLEMSLNRDRTFELFSNFMPRLSEIPNKLSFEKLCVRVYPDSYDFRNFDYNASFEKWVAVEVLNTEFIPEGMKELIIEEGQYAVFLHKGPASEGEKTYRFIFEEWLAKSGYTVDTRPHFDVLGEKYKNNHPASEEEIWIPIKKA